MAIEIEKTFTVNAGPAAVWELMIDPERVARCLPGAAITGKVDDRTWSGTMTVKLGPVKSSYKGKVVFDRLDAAARTAEIKASGMDTGGKGGADLLLTSAVRETAPGVSEVKTVSRVNVTGILAQMGRGMVQDVSDQLFQVFTQNVRAELEKQAPAQAVNAPAITAPTSTAAPAQALDLGLVGARAVVRQPAFWIAVAAVAVALWFALRR